MYDLLIKNCSLNGNITDIAVKDGIIAAIGKCEDAAAAGIYHADGLAVIPPFYNTHTHAAMTLLRSYAEDMELFDWLSNHIWPIEAKLTEEDIYIGTRLATVEMIRSGTVYFNDSYWMPRSALRAVREAGMRATLGLLYLCNPSGDVPDAARKANDELLEACGEQDSLINVAHAPHAIYTISTGILSSIAKQMEHDGFPVHIHVAETAREVEDCRREHNGMTPVEYLDSLGLINERAMLAHCVHLTGNDREIIARRGAFIAHNPVSNLKLCSGIFDFERARAAGCRVTLGTDGSSSNNSLSMLDEMKFAALSAKFTGCSPKAGKVGDIFNIATTAGAAFAGVDGGTIAVGKAADMLLVNLKHPVLSAGYDLISDLVYAGEPQMIDSTICNGKFLMKNRIIPGEAEIIDAAAKVCAKLKNIA